MAIFDDLMNVGGDGELLLVISEHKLASGGQQGCALSECELTSVFLSLLDWERW